LPQAIDRKNSFHTIIEQGATMTDAKGDKIDIDTPEPPPLTQREMNQFITLAALPTLERALERLRWLEAENAALKARDPLAEMWRELSEYQPQADRDGHGESWKRMCEERTEETANAAAWARGASVLASHAANAASWAVARRRSSDGSASNALALIRQAKEAKP
jgi:hypothetical protein